MEHITIRRPRLKIMTGNIICDWWSDDDGDKIIEEITKLGTYVWTYKNKRLQSVILNQKIETKFFD